jgi:hypothetical protein
MHQHSNRAGVLNVGSRAFQQTAVSQVQGGHVVSLGAAFERAVRKYSCGQDEVGRRVQEFGGCFAVVPWFSSDSVRSTISRQITIRSAPSHLPSVECAASVMTNAAGRTGR